MPRLRRLDYPHARHHGMNRGARRAPVFLAEEDCVSFLDLLASCTTLFALRRVGQPHDPELARWREVLASMEEARE